MCKELENTHLKWFFEEAAILTEYIYNKKLIKVSKMLNIQHSVELLLDLLTKEHN